jgi:hypothetical protein
MLIERSLHVSLFIFISHPSKQSNLSNARRLHFLPSFIFSLLSAAMYIEIDAEKKKETF